ncbi:MAG: SPOR domain-containing protein [Azonexus sp.]|jgi:DedD protein|uniref:SPOR domain-containing protein n=1 Tax=Azonexus sp. TaxID=1872668 RepID=UPI0028353D6B|nr:SPOR domain-containing protein [Azonexus sp.]MDR0775880.1 SPOR domain-containing protein [Azonexus sp.]
MADNDETTADNDNAAELRGTLMRRLAMAGVLVAILLGVLAFFDHLASVPDEPEAPVFTEPVPVAPHKEVSQPVTPTEPDELPADDGTPTAEAPPAPVVELKPTAGTGSELESAPVGQRPASTPATPPRPPPVARPVPVIEETASPQPVAPPPAPAAAPVKPSATARLFSGFVLQAGVFSSPQLAEELRAKLTLSGVPSSVETRVQVGPFHTRQEAEAAQARLKELGIQTILIAPAAGRR